MRDRAPLSSSPRRIRHSNALAALDTLFRHGGLSRAELARHLGLNRSSSGNIVAELAANDLIREVQAQSKSRSGQAGRPGILLELNPKAACFVGVEIGVEHITTLQIDMTAQVIASRVTPFDGRAVSATEAVAQAIEQAFSDLPDALAETVEGLGLSAPAQMDRNGIVCIAPLLGWQNEDLTDLAETAIGRDIPVRVENDANAFAIGESYCDPQAQAGVTLVLVIETGVGGGIVIDGQVFRGGNGLAGEIGHLHLPGGDELEEAIGLDRLLSKFRADRGTGGASLAALLDAVKAGEATAVTIAEDWARDLAQALVSACRLIDPNRIVLGGSIAALYPLVADVVAKEIAALQSPTFPKPGISVHGSAEFGAAYGAACMMHRRFLSAENTGLIDAQSQDTGEPER